MSRQKYEKTFNTFTKGLMTEASELNFPEDFSLYEKNFLLHRDGGRDRRKGMELVYPLGMTLTSTLYPIEFDDALAPSAVAPSVSWNVWPVETIGPTMLPPSIVIDTAVKYLEYHNGKPESLAPMALEPSIEILTVFVPPTTHEYRIPEEVLVPTALAPAIVINTVAEYVEYYIPEESLEPMALAPAITITTV